MDVSWTLKKAERGRGKKKAECQRIDAFELWLEKTLESPLDCRQIKSANLKGNQS